MAVAFFSMDKPEQSLLLDSEKCSRVAKGDEIRTVAAFVARSQVRFCPFSNQLCPFKLDDDLPLPFYCHKSLRLRAKIVAFEYLHRMK